MLRGIIFAVAGALVLHLAAGIGIDHRAAANDDVPRAEQTGQQPSRFIAPAAASMIVLPGSASASDRAAGDEVAAQQALLRRAETEANAAAEIRRKAEDLSRRFVAEHGVSGAPSTETSIAPLGMTRAAALVPAPVAQNESVPATLHSPARSAIVTEPDPLGDARRQAAEADARAAAERAARLSAEANASLAIEQAAAALARAKRDAEAAAHRADAAEARAMKATREAQRNMAKAATAAVAAGKQKAVSTAIAVAKPGQLPSAVTAVKPGTVTAAARSAQLPPPAALGAHPMPQRTEQAKPLFTPPSPPFLLSIVPSFAK